MRWTAGCSPPFLFWGCPQWQERFPGGNESQNGYSFLQTWEGNFHKYAIAYPLGWKFLKPMFLLSSRFSWNQVAGWLTTGGCGHSGRWFSVVFWCRDSLPFSVGIPMARWWVSVACVVHGWYWWRIGISSLPFVSGLPVGFWLVGVSVHGECIWKARLRLPKRIGNRRHKFRTTMVHGRYAGLGSAFHSNVRWHP